jgi:hypothetical protein
VLASVSGGEYSHVDGRGPSRMSCGLPRRRNTSALPRCRTNDRDHRDPRSLEGARRAFLPRSGLRRSRLRAAQGRTGRTLGDPRGGRLTESRSATILRPAIESEAGATLALCTLAMIRTPACFPLYVGTFVVVVIAITFSVLGCFPHHTGEAPAATPTVAPDEAPTFSPDSFPDIDRANR